jgi:isoamylase
MLPGLARGEKMISQTISPNQSLLGAALLMRGASMREGKPFPLGATWDGLGVNFALFFCACDES